MSTPHLIAYHAGCNDGQIAAFVAWKYTGRKATTVPVNYDLHSKDFTEILKHLTKELPEDAMYHEHRLIIVDFSFPYPVLELLGQVFQSVLVIDHHKTAQDDLQQHAQPTSVVVSATQVSKSFYQISDNVSVWFCMEESGALMTWRYFAGEDVPSADFVKYTSDRDLWKFLDPKTRPFASGMGLYRGLAWHQLEEVLSDTPKVVQQGEVIEAVRMERVKSILKHPPRHMQATVGDTLYDIGCYNAPSDIVSDLLDTYTQKEGNYPVGMSYTIGSDDVVYVSLRSQIQIDCSVIAKLLGGGGHAQACGFIVPLMHFVEMLKTNDLTCAYTPS